MAEGGQLDAQLRGHHARAAVGGGLFAFFYATVHVLTWVALYNNFDLHNMLVDVARRRYITAGMAAYLSLLPLALTSTAWAIRKLGGKNWSRLHMLI
ncbi:MAG: ferric reductase-like transmembrane domain-containing protein, partial [Terriglobia bacterium]